MQFFSLCWVFTLEPLHALFHVNCASAYLHHLIFAISVFHAFGHQWPCQIIYHPRKCNGFGLSDGEGCKRFWNSIKKLIAYLCVCGSHQCVYTLDRQVQQADKETLGRLAFWLLRRSRHCQDKRHLAEVVLTECGVPDGVLQDEWSAQVQAQTKPLPHTFNCVQDQENIILNPLASDYHLCDAELHLAEAKKALSSAESWVHASESALGIHKRAKLGKLLGSPFIAVRMNARALKLCLRERLCSQKFELDRIKRSYRNHVNECKVHHHLEDSMKHHNPSIQKLARDYNNLCDVMLWLKSQRKAPLGSVCLSKIVMKGLFALDVDNEIWQDVGLEDSLDGAMTDPPLWLCDNLVRSGIRARLELDRCIEEEEHIKHERKVLQIWYSEEWNVTCSTYDNTASHHVLDSLELCYQLQLRKDELLHVLSIWKKSLQSLRVDTVIPAWGPTDDEITAAQISQVTSHLYDDYNDMEEFRPSIGVNELNPSDVESLNEDLIDTLEAIDLADAFRGEDFDKHPVSICGSPPLALFIAWMSEQMLWDSHVRF
ncbi:uncharacterized protein LACBIDRAFT_324780 [Laccaria bicolor S238N-H82]|uniref:Predicted protein n=1 Tax=Laccaria bicolor (strain S238N-H82 / ATCC MYA-4686) TaxID=486041 RepID=B0D309_LACBS|nr:uncharacterized protein LACBIDRAFT_324780 [Laccaria bicolor S238N-H82]EDR10841.1 predicted protein [Laccaria bicolor S238N-H82]|eukprot:XP_001878142.1 predicted protein [Laccaria bicolor S238N-H82]